ncbi:unnamed protein product [Bursaphelenchus xylophilus]|uniref:(pine wood nematode) hypothetical protein n=1 Tax=Bursaphelenchus xylophilus TaxID=6326 RepID=A0A1I7SQ62_BURXY|nr:unnamed protein product [Bursaphelenchus xylophilus]CAG9109645.1 unnamed protein product [Bursaphelenchus xylophilus]
MLLLYPRQLSRVLAGCRRFSAAPNLVELGTLSSPKVEDRYPAGQVFLHRVFAYRGVVVCSFDCKVYGKQKANENTSKFEVVPYYQVLIHKGDWDHMRMPVDLTVYLSENGGREGKSIGIINGMDCVPHNDILPLEYRVQKNGTAPIDHDLFDRLFKFMDPNRPELGYVNTHNVPSQRSWMAPQATHVETTNNVRVTATTFYLGQNSINGQIKHCWRYVVRLENLDGSDLILRDRQIKVFSLNNLTQVNGGGVVGEYPRLSTADPAYQFSSTVQLLQKKGGHLWGKFKLEKEEDGTVFEVNMPTLLLESNSSQNSHGNNENVVQ